VKTSARTASTGLDELLDDPKALSRLRILRATRRLMAERGLSVTMEQAAEAAGVGRRTLFRYFPTRDVLIAEALASGMERFYQGVEALTLDGGSLDDWLEAVAYEVQRNLRDEGLAMWELTASGDAGLAPELVRVNRARRAARKAGVAGIARAAWMRAGGVGQCPDIVAHACGLIFSAFTTRSMVDDFGVDLDALARCSVRMLAALIHAEVAAAATLPTARDKRASAVSRTTKGR